MNSIEDINKIFQMKTIAVVGMSPKAERPSHYVSMYMKEQGYNIIPVNPGHNEIAGMKSFPSLLDIPQTIDVVDVFRRSEYVLPIAKSAVTVGAKALWLQDGVINEDGAKLAEKAGLLVVMNDCILRQHRQMQTN
ncbi:Succinyl-CoA synthetase, alpha subunit-related enzymes [hydrothermal vent metagenome]|uniref:Succinyl-CoA synthetase, alpha subunit-related enzymes n=1 Tax=hydrothermal vent metagenome TaxID=652676 RepID=A0A160VI50_9ZZZZ